MNFEVRYFVRNHWISGLYIWSTSLHSYKRFRQLYMFLSSGKGKAETLLDPIGRGNPYHWAKIETFNDSDYYIQSSEPYRSNFMFAQHRPNYYSCLNAIVTP
jgi:hypothetical protein